MTAQGRRSSKVTCTLESTRAIPGSSGDGKAPKNQLLTAVDSSMTDHAIVESAQNYAQNTGPILPLYARGLPACGLGGPEAKRGVSKSVPADPSL